MTSPSSSLPEARLVAFAPVPQTTPAASGMGEGREALQRGEP